MGSTSEAQPKPHAIWGKPTNGQSPREVVMLIHGGGWAGIDPTAVQETAAQAPIYESAGYETVVPDYRRGAQGIDDVERFYHEAQRRFPNLPICVVGNSAGGHIALMLAVKDPDLACAVSLAGPTDLPALASEPGGEIADRLATKNFGDTSQFKELSPALHADSICARVLLIYARNDPIVPVAQGEEMARALPSATLIVLPPGTAGFVHSGGEAQYGVDVAARTQAYGQLAGLLNEVAQSPSAGCHA